MIYLDHAATTPLDPRALEAMLPLLRENFGNPSGLHSLAERASRSLEEARAEVARLVGAPHPSSIIFTSGGSESNNLAILGLARQRQPRRHILVSRIEHKSVLNPLHTLEEFQIEEWSPDPQGRFHVHDLQARIGMDTLLVSVGLANNEIGTLQDISQLAAAAHQRGALFHCDAVAAAGKLAIDVEALQVDSLSLSAHKFYGPKGIGALYLRRPELLQPVTSGGGQEFGLRSGTQNVAGAVALAAALGECQRRQAEESQRLSRLSQDLWDSIKARVPSAERLGCPQHCLPNLLSIVVPEAHGESLALEMSRQGVAVSSGSACSTMAPGPSHVLQGVGISPPLLHGNLRFSLGRSTTPQDIPLVVEALCASLRLHGQVSRVF